MINVAKLSPKERQAWFAKLSPDEQRVWVVAVAEVLGRRLGKDKGERSAAHRAYDRKSAGAWKADPEFGDALNLAIEIGVTKPLRDYVASGKPIPKEIVSVKDWGCPVPQDVRTLVDELLGNQPQQQPQKQGRLRRIANKARLAEQAERNAAWLVAFAQKDWRKRNACERVPRVETEEMILAAIKEAAKAFGVPVSTINASNIRNVLKNHRVVVP
jgi:hypothetical protein